MALRFRKSFKLALGIRMNLSGSGASLSVGPRGSSIGIGRRGTYLNTGIPGTGLYARQRIGGGGHAAKPKSAGQQASQSLSIAVAISGDGTISFRDAAGNMLSDQVVRAAKRQHGDAIKGLIQQKCDEINQEVDAVGEIHLHTPSPSEKPVYVRAEYEECKPDEPSQKKLGFIPSLFKRLREKNEEKNRAELVEYQERLNLWERGKAQFEANEARQKTLVEALIYTDTGAMEEFLEESLQEIAWPRETNVSTEVLAGGRVIFIDVDLPEIEDMPNKKAAVPANGYKLSVKDLSAANIQRLYMQHVHGIAFRTIGEVFAALPKAEEVVLSGYSQRPSKSTGQISDEYLLSVRVKRPDWSELAFGNLQSVDVVESLARFDLRRSMSKTGVFKPIEPYSPAESCISGG